MARYLWDEVANLRKLIRDIELISGSDGADGLSAYEVAVANGFIGTELDWLDSLVGADGADGPAGADGDSAYEVAVANGFIGTELDWLDSLVGSDGADGPAGAAGADGDSAYEVAVANGFVGTEVEWLESLEAQALVPIAGTPPLDPEPGQLWFDDESGNTFIWYDDGDSAQWVIAIQVTDGVNLVPVEDNAVYAGGPKSFDLSDTPYTGYVAVYVNGVRLDKTDWELTGTTLTVLGDLESGDEVTLDFFIVSNAVECVDPYGLQLSQYYDIDMDTDGTPHEYFDGNPALVFDTLAWADLNTFADVEKDI